MAAIKVSSDKSSPMTITSLAQISFSGGVLAVSKFYALKKYEQPLLELLYEGDR